MSNKESMEMYLETVLILERDHGHAHASEIAKQLGVSKPSVTKAMNVLKANGLVHKQPYGTITLTSKGRAYSEKILSKHHLITRYLIHSLGLTEAEATENACKMEHVISSDMLKAINEYLSLNKISNER